MTVSVISGVAGTLENGVAVFVNAKAAVLSTALLPVAAAALSIWAILYGIAVVRGEVQEPLWGFSWKLFKTTLILGFALGQGVYQTQIITAVYSVADGLVSVMAGGRVTACLASGTGQQVYASLDCTWTQFMEIGMAYYRDGQEAGFWSAPDVAIARFISALLVWVSGSLFTVVMAAEIVVARFMLGLALVFGPIFIATLAFEPSKKYFDGWSGFIWFCVVMQAVCVAFLGLGMVAIEQVMNPLGVPGAVSDPNSWAAFQKAIQDSGNAWTAILAIVTMTCLLLYIGAFRLSGLASAITGGGSHASLAGAAVAFVAGQALRGMGGSGGKPAGGGQISNAGGNGASASSPNVGTKSGGGITPTASQQASREGRASTSGSSQSTSSQEKASESTPSSTSQATEEGRSSGNTYRSDLHRTANQTGERAGRTIGRAARIMRNKRKP